jgi:predicted negative regulator of RcsB-dependent stress response
MSNCKRFGYEVISFYDFIKEENISLINLLKMFKKEIKQTFLEVLIGVLVIIGFALFIYITTFNF